MKANNRLDTALKKLYTAFHDNTLHPECCKQCAVGNILDQSDAWKHFSDEHGSTKLNYIGQVNEAFGKRFNGYTPSELLYIEKTFLEACGYQVPLHHKNKKPEKPTDSEILFNGLQAVIEFLCRLDNSPNVMSYTKLFKTIKSDKPLMVDSND